MTLSLHNKTISICSSILIGGEKVSATLEFFFTIFLVFSKVRRSGGHDACILPENCGWEHLAQTGNLSTLVSTEVYLVSPHPLLYKGCSYVVSSSKT